MSFRRHLHTFAVLALSAGACFNRTDAPKPPTFPNGGFLARAVPLANPALLSQLEGVYNTSSRFGSGVVVRSSVLHTNYGDPSDQLEAPTLSLLAYDHLGFAILEAGCLSDNAMQVAAAPSRLVLEGYWRYLDAPMPDSSSTGLVRLFVTPASLADAICSASPPSTLPDLPATLSGATGDGNVAPDNALAVTYSHPLKSREVEGKKSFFVGAHHGGCQTLQNCGISENTPETFVLAKHLGADYIEVDVRLTADNVPICFHLGLSPAAVQGVYCSGAVEDFTYKQLLANCRLRNGEVIPRLEDVLEYGLRRTDLVIWLDLKTSNTVVPASQVLINLAAKYPNTRLLQRVAMGLPDSDVMGAFQSAKQAGQLMPDQRCLIEDAPSDVINVPCQGWGPRYTRGPMAGDVQNLQSQGKFVGYWTINDPTTIDAFLGAGKPNGILTNDLGLLNQRWEAVGVLPLYPVQLGP
jgi:glycerophosphoryl diester phosphodiesterase